MRRPSRTKKPPLMNPSVACGFSLNSRTRPPSMHHLAEAARRADRGDGGHLAVRAVERDGGADVDVGDAVAVGEQEGLVALDVAAHRRHPAAGHGLLAGLGQRDLPVLLVVPAQHLDGAVLAEGDGEVGRHGLVVEEELLDEPSPCSRGRARTRAPRGGRRSS